VTEKFQVEEDGDVLLVTWKWFNLKHVFLAFFSFFWLSFLAVWYGMAFTSGMGDLGAFALIVYLFPLGHVAVGFGLAYYTLCGFLNSTTVAVGRDSLIVNHHPLWWRGNVLIPATEIGQLFVSRQVTRTKNGKSISYSLEMLGKKGERRKVVRGMTSLEQVRWLETKLEEKLGIKNAPVADEHA